MLLLQGRRVRRDTLKLPEPEGPRAGTLGSGPPLSLLLLGDSAAAGVGARTQAEAVSGQLTQRLAQRFTVTWTLVARTGATTAGTLRHLEKNGVPSCDVAVVSVGLNDVTSARPLRPWLADIQRLVTRLRHNAGARFIVLSGIPPMHHFPALPQPLRWYLGLGAQRFDRALERYAEASEDLAHVPLRMPFTPDYMAEDGFHPSARAHALWAEELALCIGRRFSASPPATSR